MTMRKSLVAAAGAMVLAISVSGCGLKRELAPEQYTDPTTGCVYLIVSRESGRTADYAITPMLRADGLPNCPEVKS